MVIHEIHRDICPIECLWWGLRSGGRCYEVFNHCGVELSVLLKHRLREDAEGHPSGPDRDHRSGENTSFHDGLSHGIEP